MIANPKWCDYSIARDYGLRPRHIDLIAGAAKGMQNVDIAAEVGLTHDGVRSGWARIYRILKVHERSAAVARAYDLGIFRPLADRAALNDPSLSREQQLALLRYRLAELVGMLDSAPVVEHLAAAS